MVNSTQVPSSTSASSTGTPWQGQEVGSSYVFVKKESDRGKASWMPMVNSTQVPSSTSASSTGTPWQGQEVGSSYVFVKNTFLEEHEVRNASLPLRKSRSFSDITDAARLYDCESSRYPWH